MHEHMFYYVCIYSLKPVLFYDVAIGDMHFSKLDKGHIIYVSVGTQTVSKLL